MLSALYLFAYLSLGAVALLLGKVATAFGFGLAVDLGAGAIAFLSAAAIVLAASIHTRASMSNDAGRA